MFRYPVKYRPSLFNHFYYLLNLSKTKQIQDLLLHYLIRSEEEWEMDLKTGKIEIRNQPSFSFAPSVLKQSILSSAEGDSNKQYFSPSELKENYRKSIEMILNMFRWLRECDLSAVKNRVSLPGYPLRDKDSKQLKEIIDFFTRRGFSLQDVLIRCSTEHTLIEGDRYVDGSTDRLSLPMTHYSILWNALEEHGYLKNQTD
jgi:predicted nuclease of restriction endonuclease-like RecB superfamily